MSICSKTNETLLGRGAYQECRPAGFWVPFPPPRPTFLSLRSRNPDKDERPWCYVVKDSALSWEYCRLAACGAQSVQQGTALSPLPWGSLHFSLGPPCSIHAWPPLFGGPLLHLKDEETGSLRQG